MQHNVITMSTLPFCEPSQEPICLRPIDVRCKRAGLLSCIECSHLPFSHENISVHTMIRFIDGDFVVHNNGIMWTLGSAETIFDGLVPKCIEGLRNSTEFSIGAIVTSFVERVVIGDEPLKRVFLMKLRGAVLSSIYFPIANKVKLRNHSWLRKALNFAPTLCVPGVRLDASRFDPNVFQSIPGNLIPAGMGKLYTSCLQELCFLSSIREVVNPDPLLSQRFQRVDSIVEYLYSRKSLVRTNCDLIYDWIDARASEISEDYTDYHCAREPLVILFQGKAGSGKTTRIQQMCEYLGIPPSEVYWRQQTNHWDGYCGQLVTVFDDLFQGARSTRLAEFVNVVNSVPVPLPMASIEQKGTLFTSPIVIVTANGLTVPKSVNTSAIARRVNMPFKVIEGQIYEGVFGISEKEPFHLKSAGHNAVSMGWILNKISNHCYSKPLPRMTPLDPRVVDSESEREVLAVRPEAAVPTLPTVQTVSSSSVSSELFSFLKERVIEPTAVEIAVADPVVDSSSQTSESISNVYEFFDVARPCTTGTWYRLKDEVHYRKMFSHQDFESMNEQQLYEYDAFVVNFLTEILRKRDCTIMAQCSDEEMSAELNGLYADKRRCIIRCAKIMKQWAADELNLELDEGRQRAHMWHRFELLDVKESVAFAVDCLAKLRRGEQLTREPIERWTWRAKELFYREKQGVSATVRFRSPYYLSKRLARLSELIRE
nr:Non structural protein CDS [Astacus astacus]